MTKTLFEAAGIVGVLLVVAAGCKRDAAEQPPATQPPQAQVTSSPPATQAAPAQPAASAPAPTQPLQAQPAGDSSPSAQAPQGRASGSASATAQPAQKRASSPQAAAKPPQPRASVEPAAQPPAASSAPASAPAARAEEPKFREVTIPTGTKIGVRLESALSSKTSAAEDPVEATVVSPVKIEGAEVVPAGSEIKGQVTEAKPAGKVKGRAQLAIRFGTLSMHGDSYSVVAHVSRIAPATKKEDAEKIGIPAAGGAIIGAIVGGKKGAAIGAAAGGGAGTAVVLATPGKEVSIPKGSVLSLTMQKPVTVRVPLK